MPPPDTPAPRSPAGPPATGFLSISRRRSAIAIVGWTLFATFSGASRAQAFPTRTVRIVVPFAPGGPTDLMARAIAKPMSAALGQAVIVDNKPGAGGVIGLTELARAPADGHTLAFPSILAVTNPALMSNFPFDIVRDFAPVTVVGFIPHAMVVRPEFPARTLADFIALAKDKPGELAYASSGNGTSAHLAGAMFAERAGVRMTHVPYKGAGPALQDLLGGQVHMMFLDMSSALTQVRAGKLRALAVAPARRVALLPQVLPLAEQGLEGFDIRAWYGLLVRAGTDTAVVARLQEEVRRALQSPDVRETFANAGIEPGGMSAGEFGQIIREDLAHWRSTVQRLNIRLE